MATPKKSNRQQDAPKQPAACYYQPTIGGRRHGTRTSGRSLKDTRFSQIEASIKHELEPDDQVGTDINIGRHFTLNDVMGEDMQDSDGVGIVIGRLMMVADILGMAPASVALDDCISSRVERNLIEKFFLEKAGEMAVPDVSLCKAAMLRLQPERESAHKTENDEYFLLDDPEVHGMSKMKKAFCEPGNSSFCPPIVLASTFTFSIGSTDGGRLPPCCCFVESRGVILVVKRSPENGGDIEFQSEEELSKTFADGSLQPEDLKAAASQIMVDVLDRVANGIKQDGEATRASKALKAFQKKMSKKKK